MGWRHQQFASIIDKSNKIYYFCQVYINRQLTKVLHLATARFPSVLVTGPRQSGKTTFLRRELGKTYHFASFDDPLNRQYATQDPNGFLDQLDTPAILDEIQYAPDLLSYIKIRIDREREQNGRWVLTGSHQFAMMKNVSESLAGRIALLELLPFNYLELQGSARRLEDLLWSGFYPEPALHPSKRDLWMSSYIQTYVERDIRMLQNVHDLHTFENFVALAAARHGQLFNKAAFARDCGISEPTVRIWGDLLLASYLVFYLHPYFKNYGKRLTKTPKMYLLDPGIVCTLTRQPSGAAALAGPLGGVLFEGLVIAEAQKQFRNLGKTPDLFFWRSHDGLEVDLIIQIKNRVVPVEIKLTATPQLKHLEPLDRFKALAGKEAMGNGLLICRIDKPVDLPGNNTAMPWTLFPAWLNHALQA